MLKECQAWFSDLHLEYVIPPQVLRLELIFLVDGSWTYTSLYNGQTQLMGTRNIRRRELPLLIELALQWTMESILHHSTCQCFGMDCKEVIAMVGGPDVWPIFSTELKDIKDRTNRVQDLKIPISLGDRMELQII